MGSTEAAAVPAAAWASAGEGGERPGGPLDPGQAADGAVAIAGELGLSITVADVLFRRGRVGDEATKRWLDPRLAHMTAPDAMADREACADRLARAVRARERICVFGDYDCDGITSAAVMTGTLRAMGGEVVPLLASRAAGGYGFSAPALERVKATGATVLVTCDCGSSDHPRLEGARAAGIDVIVIDHHLVPAEPLPALAFLNPHRPECGFPYKGMASCGLALSVAAAVRKQLGVELDLRRWLDLVAIGTVADVAPLDGDNRALVRSGLATLARGERPGLRALAGLAKLDLGQGVTGEDIAFRIAPRINAPGRLGDPDVALELLLEGDATLAAALAATIEQITIKRRMLQEQMLAEAQADIEAGRFAEQPAIVLAREGWHPGIVGIIAGRIATRYARPVIVVGMEGPTGRGSVRGPPGSRLHDALVRCREDLVAFGGHQAAAGVEVRADRLAALRDRWCEAHAAGGVAEAPPVEADVRLDERDDPFDVVRDLARLEPCGESNRAPRLFVRQARVLSAKDVKGHLALELDVAGRSMRAFGFEMAPSLPGLAGKRVDLVGYLRRDGWKGGAAVELRIERL